MCTTTTVEHDDLHVLVGLVKTVCQSCGSRFVDDTFYFKSCDLPGFFRCLALCIVKVSRYSNDGPGHFLSEKIFGSFLHFLKDHGRNLLWCIFAIVDLYTRGVVVSFDDLVRYMSNLFLRFIKSNTHET